MGIHGRAKGSISERRLLDRSSVERQDGTHPKDFTREARDARDRH
jgi:hypothetical protein